ncbi:MAG: hypothetical protein KA109_04215 [Saprospiraceae bacterium]|nr:hypothetical protein [Saprospiraceae bacterium]MBK7606487.1 hypothetical protein [Saprospiraceae bacterium]MBK8513971.1 hypothetical protein [Saprospiraceae bacterium]MBL0112625.1 hypothetical protein [Saprospiraceae bacterium]MBP7800807.1 hypothetical protein [Saprospiraceae bacterium]
MPNLEKIHNGELYWDPYRSTTYGPLDYYTFGYDATLIDFYKDKSIISYSYSDEEVEVPSEEVYQFMKEWSEALRAWRKDNPQKDMNQ